MALPSAPTSSVVGRYGRRRQSCWDHFWMFMFTTGIGNVFYAMHVSRWDRDRCL
ncbi:hypothetical protein ACIQ6K_34835 [Streptomyces sp. NPDC096354]|uniref:hypothetical protein n=1 Tax=Streptomyces sp. NPDC096354 TaxID=3366088 RepID=UPI003823E951